MHPPTVGYIITLNEADYIENSLKSLIPTVNYLFIIDGGSTDDTVSRVNNTLKGCNTCTYVVSEHKWDSNIPNMFQIQRNYALSVIKKEILEKYNLNYCWVLSIDADEILDPKLYSKIEQLEQKTLDQGKNCIGFKRVTYVGEKIQNPGPDWQYRLFVYTGDQYYAGVLHEQIYGEMEIATSSFILKHKRTALRQGLNQRYFEKIIPNLLHKRNITITQDRGRFNYTQKIEE